MQVRHKSDFPLVPKSATFSDLERRTGRVVLCFAKIRPTVSAAKCSRENLLSARCFYVIVIDMIYLMIFPTHKNYNFMHLYYIRLTSQTYNMQATGISLRTSNAG